MQRAVIPLVVIALSVIAAISAISPRLGMEPYEAATEPPATALRSGLAAAPGQHPRHGVPETVATYALARAFAALGLAQAGDPRLLAALDPNARDRLDDARILLLETPLYAHPGAGAAGRSTVAGDAASPESASASGSATAGGAASGQAPATAGGIALATAHAGGGPMTLDLAQAVDPAQALHETPQGPVLVAGGLWAKVLFNPSQQQQLVITNGCSDGYAIAIYAADFSTIRLDGGLVVPGRYYQVDGHSVITGDAGCSVDIRPLAVVPAFSLAPAQVPHTDG